MDEPTEMKDIRQRLLALREELTGDSTLMASEALAGDRAEGEGHPASIPQHLAERGTDAFEQEYTLGRLENANEVIRQIDEALERYEEGTLGRCAECNEPISPRRLQIKPYALYCVQCQERMEEELG